MLNKVAADPDILRDLAMGFIRESADGLVTAEPEPGIGVDTEFTSFTALMAKSAADYTKPLIQALECGT